MIGDRIDSSVRTVMLFGGSFDPPHKGHVHLPLLAARHLERLQDEEKGVWILYIPAARSPHKARGPAASDAQRVAMLHLATEHLPRCGVWTDEIDRAAGGAGAPSYTVDTLRRLRSWLDDHGGDDVRLRLLIGADQAAALDKWREPEAVVGLADPLVMARDTTAVFPQGLGDWGRRLLPVAKLDVSSTAVRTALAAGGGGDAVLKRSLDAPVLAYIREHALYL
jgi:nicotinate-nucleotide adenylyltransferase